jgi:hypothetical protein
MIGLADAVLVLHLCAWRMQSRYPQGVDFDYFADLAARA